MDKVEELTRLMRNPFERLTKDERETCEAIIRAYLGPLFHQYMLTVEHDKRNWYFDMRNSDEYLRSFGQWLVERIPEFASND